MAFFGLNGAIQMPGRPCNAVPIGLLPPKRRNTTVPSSKGVENDEDQWLVGVILPNWRSLKAQVLDNVVGTSHPWWSQVQWSFHDQIGGFQRHWHCCRHEAVASKTWKVFAMIKTEG